MPSNDLDLTDFAALTPESVERACREAMANCDARLAGIAAVADGERTYTNTMIALEEATDGVSFASGTFAFMAHVAADDALREKARAMDEELDKYLACRFAKTSTRP